MLRVGNRKEYTLSYVYVYKIHSFFYNIDAPATHHHHDTTITASKCWNKIPNIVHLVCVLYYASMNVCSVYLRMYIFTKCIFCYYSQALFSDEKEDLKMLLVLWSLGMFFL